MNVKLNQIAFNTKTLEWIMFWEMPDGNEKRILIAPEAAEGIIISATFKYEIKMSDPFVYYVFGK